MSGRLESLVDAVLVRAASRRSSDDERISAARDVLTGDLTIVVSGRRGVGKTTVINALVGVDVDIAGFSAQNRPIKVLTGRLDAAPAWSATIHVPTLAPQRRRFVELPDSIGRARTDDIERVGEMRPDLLIHVVHQDLRTDDVELLREATDAWRLGTLDVLVVTMARALPDPPAASAGDSETLRRRLQAAPGTPYGQVVLGPDPHESAQTSGRLRSAVDDVEPCARACRARDALAVASELAAIEADGPWDADLEDAIEQVELAPAAHVLRERWALDEILDGNTELGDEMRADLRRLYLPSSAEDRGLDDDPRSSLPRLAARWQAHLVDLTPRAAEVARVVVRSCRLRLGSSAARVTPLTTVQPAQEVHDVPA